MNYTPSLWAVVIFVSFIALVLWISYYFARRTQSSSGYFTAGGSIHWTVNGVAFAGDYLSAASFLGICGMIAVAGYDGFLYSIGYLAGWIVALFVVAEPLKRLGKFTFTDALDARFNSKGIQFAAALSTLVVSIFYLIPQMVGAGTLVTPLLGLPHAAGVLMVGTVVVIIVATAGMASTTYVQFLKGGLLVIFSLILVFLLFSRGLTTTPDQGGKVPYRPIAVLELSQTGSGTPAPADTSYRVLGELSGGGRQFLKLERDGIESFWRLDEKRGVLEETLSVVKKSDGTLLYNGAKREDGRFFQVGSASEIDGKTDGKAGSLNPFSFIAAIRNSTIIRWSKQILTDGTDSVTVYHQNPTPGRDVLSPGLKFKVDPAMGATVTDRIDFVSLMLALFLGTAALPHILIRYYTVRSPADARKSTIVAIAAIGLFYVLTLYMGLGAMVNGVIDLTNDNMSAPLLAKSFGLIFFAIISAVAFATVLGTVSGLIVAASGAVAHDLVDRLLDRDLGDREKVIVGKTAAIVVGCIAMVLGILFKGMNVSFLVGWAFSVAASANLPSIVMLLFWKKTTAKGIVASILTGLVLSIGLILLSRSTFAGVYNLPSALAPVPIDNPAIISVPVSFLMLVVVSLFTQPKSGIPVKERGLVGA